MNIRLFIIIIIALYGCKSPKNNLTGLELILLNKSVNADKFAVNCNRFKFNKDSIYINKSRTIISYKIVNNDDCGYYLNFLSKSKIGYNISGVPILNNFGKIILFDSYNNVLKINFRNIDDFSKSDFQIYSDLKIKYLNETAENLNYNISGQEKNITDESNFFIKPNETIYFEGYINLPYGKDKFSPDVMFIDNKPVFASVIIVSDSTNYKNILSRTDLRTIEDNKYKVYNGIIKSQNKVPIKFID